MRPTEFGSVGLGTSGRLGDEPCTPAETGIFTPARGLDACSEAGRAKFARPLHVNFLVSDEGVDAEARAAIGVVHDVLQASAYEDHLLAVFAKEKYQGHVFSPRTVFGYQSVPTKYLIIF